MKLTSARLPSMTPSGAGAQPIVPVARSLLRISANVTGDFGNVTDMGRGAVLRELDCRSESV
nr:hypothetical protein [uncultured bacterium]